MPMYVSISVIPRPMQQAVIATEDRRFYEHGAIDPIGIMRAMMVNFNSGETLEGGSTISQQVVKNVFYHMSER
uniref:Penicillin-binding protein 1A n=1 Tax=uncultured Desulfotomaculum sp. TaxID=157294 RepID=A0A060CIY9_9FIRM|nr:transgly [uncultured Desulfotomaculum sp.]